MSKKNDNLKIRDNKDGTYSCRLSIGYKKDPLTGKTKQNRPTITVKADSEAEAKALITLEKIKRQNKEKDNVEELTMAEVISRYYEIKTRLRANSKAKDLFYVNIINKRFGTDKIADITLNHLLDFLHALEIHGYGKTTLRNFRNALRKFFNFAERQKYITDNPIIRLSDYDIGKGEDTRKNRSETVSDDTKAVIRYIMNHKTCRSFSLELKLQILLTLEGNLRPAEMYGLVWTDIDLTEQSMEINRDYTPLTTTQANALNLSRTVIDDTKTRGSHRLLPLSAITIDYLNKYKEETELFLKRTGAKNTMKYLFFQKKQVKSGNEVKIAYGSGFRARLNKVSKYLQVETISPYDLRRLARTERENELDLKDRVNKYVIGHVKDNETADPRYITTMYSAAKKSHPIWEKILMSIITENNVNKTECKTN